MASEYLQIGIGVANGQDSFSVGLRAAQQAFSQIKLYELSVVIVYAAIKYNLKKVLEGITSITKDAPLIGTSTAGEITELSKASDNVVVVCLASPHLRVSIGVGQNIEKDCENAVDQAFKEAKISECLSYQSRSSQLKASYLNPYRSVFALTFIAGKVNNYNARGFEAVNLLRKKSDSKLPLFGGGSSTNDDTISTYQLANGQVYTDSLVLALFETDLRFGIGKAHGFIPTANNTIITRARNYIIDELDYRPAAEVYAAMCNISLRELKKSPWKYFQGNPFGIRDIYGSYYLIDGRGITKENGIELYMQVQENTLLTLMETSVERVINAEQKAVRKACLHGEIEKPALVLLHSCVTRKDLLGNQRESCLKNISGQLNGGVLAGFYSYGEHGMSREGIPLYFNGTAVALALENELNPISEIVLGNISLYEELSALYEISTDLNSTLQLEETLGKTVRLIKDVMKVEECNLFLEEETDGRLKLKASTSINQSGERSSLLEKVCILAIKKKDPIISDSKEEIKSILAIPIIRKEKNIGVVVVTSKNSNYFSKREVDFLSALANQAGIAIENARLYRMMEYSASTDGLTGLYNHRYFQVRLQEEVNRNKRNKSTLSLLMLDIDHFKNYNDNNGHPLGDEVLKRVGEILTNNVRSIDIVARYGGEEFAIILPETSGEDAFSVAERIRENIEKISFPGEKLQPSGKLSISIGLASYSSSATSKEELIKRADQALYQAKYRGRNRVHSFENTWV